MAAKTIENNDQFLKEIELELRIFEQVSAEEFHATEVDFEVHGTDWPFLFYDNIMQLVDEQEDLTDQQRNRLANSILRARSLKEKILKHNYLYPQVIDLEFEWMPEHEHDTPQEKAVLKNDYLILIMINELEAIERLSLQGSQYDQSNWEHRLIYWKSDVYDRINPLLENADALTAEQREKLADILRRTRAIKEQLLAHHYPYPQEIDRDYAWMKG